MPRVELSAGGTDYQDTGGDGPVLLFTPGFPMNETQWRKVVPHLSGYRCVLPTLPMGAHRTPMRPDADLPERGVALLLGEFLEALDLSDVTLVMNDWAPRRRRAGREIRRDLAKFATSAPPREVLLERSERLRDFDRPALVVWATDDAMMPHEHGKRLAELLPNAQLVEVADSGTLIPEDQPEELVRVLTAFLAENGADPVRP